MLCPTAHELRDFAKGAVSDIRWQQLADHLDSCPGCEQRLAEFDAAPPLLASRPNEAGSQATDAEVHGLRNRLVQWASQQPALGSFAPTPPASFPEQGDLIGQYRLIEELGRGAMGVVYLAEHTSLKRWVALKLLAGHLLCQPEAQARFRREMEAVGRTDHPNLIHATDAGEVDGHSFLAMDYVPGVDVETLGAKFGPLPCAEACEIVAQAAAGLQQAHLHHLVHRDVKPSNLLLGMDGAIRVLDLGLALFQAPDEVHEERPMAAAARGDDHATRVGTVLGTRAYMAPEQKLDSHVDARADIYGLGATLHRLLFGSPPPQLLATQSTAQRLQTWKQMRADIGDSVLDLLDEMLDEAPARRPQSMSEVLQRLDQPRRDSAWFDLLQQVRSKGLASRELPRPGVLQAQLASRPETWAAAPAAKSAPASPWLVGGGILGCLGIGTISIVMALAIGWLFWLGSPRPELSNSQNESSTETIGSNNTRSTDAAGTTTVHRSPRLGGHAVRLSSSGYVEIRDSAFLIDGEQPFTVELWLRTTQEVSWDAIVLGTAPTDRFATLGPWSSGWSLKLSATPFRQNWQLENQGRQSMGGLPASLGGGNVGLIQGHWHYLVLTRQGSQWQVWVDGRQQYATTSLPGLPNRSSQVGNLRIGSGASHGPAMGLAMELAAVRLSQGALDPTQLRPAYPLSKQETTVAVLDFTTPQVETLADQTDQGHVGKLVGASWVAIE